MPKRIRKWKEITDPCQDIREVFPGHLVQVQMCDRTSAKEKSRRLLSHACTHPPSISQPSKCCKTNLLGNHLPFVGWVSCIEMWLISTSTPLPCQKELGNGRKSRDPCHDISEVFLGHVVQVQMCDFTNAKEKSS